MAIKAEDITREQVYELLSKYDGQKKPTKKLRQYFIDNLGDIEDPEIDTSERGGLGKSTHVVDMVLEDLDSYAS